MCQNSQVTEEPVKEETKNEKDELFGLGATQLQMTFLDRLEICNGVGVGVNGG